MKNPVKLVLAALFLLGVAACQKPKKVSVPIAFDMNYSTTQNIDSDSVNVSAPVEFITPQIATQSSSTFNSQKTSQEQIDEVKMTKFEIANQTGNLDFLKSISVYIRAPGLADVLVATKTNVPKGLTTLACDMTGANIKEHIFKDQIQFRISVTVNYAPAASQQLKLDQTVRVSGKLL